MSFTSAAARRLKSSTLPSHFGSTPSPCSTRSIRAGTVPSHAAWWATTSFSDQPEASCSSNRSGGNASTTAREATYPWSTFASRSLLEIAGVVVDTEHLLEHLYLLADARVRARAFEELRHELAACLRRDPQAIHRLAPPSGVALRAHVLQALDLLALDLGIELERRDRRLGLGRVLVDPDDRPLAPLDLLLEAERRLGDLALRVAALDRFDHAAQLLDLAEVAVEALLHHVREVLEVIGAGEWVRRVGHAGLMCDHLLRAQRERHGFLRRKRIRLVERVRVERLRAPEHRGERLQRDADDVGVRLLRRERHARGLRVRAQLKRPRIGRVVAALDLACPDPPRRPELRDRLEEVVVDVEEERHPRHEVVHIEARGDAPLHVLETVDEGERQLLDRRRARLANVVTGDRDRVPLRHLARSEAEGVDDQIHGGPLGHDPLALRDVFLESVVLDRSTERGERIAALLPGREVHRPHDRGRPVDRLPRRDLVDRDPLGGEP